MTAHIYEAAIQVEGLDSFSPFILAHPCGMKCQTLNLSQENQIVVSNAGNIHLCPPYIVYILLTRLLESRREERLSTCPELTLQTASSAVNCAVTSHSCCKKKLNTCDFYPKCSCLKLNVTCKCEIETKDLDLVQLQLKIRVSPAQASAGISTRHMLSAALHSSVSHAYYIYITIRIHKNTHTLDKKWGCVKIRVWIGPR